MKELNFIREKIKENKILLSNFSYLSILQVVSLLLPLITYPYLIRVLGSELYGLVVFTQVIATYFNVFISFGFTLFGAKEVSIHREDKTKLSEIVSTISLIKIAFFIISLIILYIYFLFKPQEYELLYFLGFSICIADILFPSWFFQGIEKMKYITLISLGTRVIIIGLIFIFIHSKEDVLWYSILNLISALLSGFTAIYFIHKEGIRWHWASFQTIKHYLNASKEFFIQSAIIQVYVNTNKAVIGTFLGMSAVAYYDLAEKIVNIIRMPQGIISQVVFPRVSATKSTSFIEKIFKLSMVLNIGLYLFLFVFAEYLVIFLAGEKMLPAVPLIRILGLLAPVIAVSNVLAILTLIPFGYNHLFTKMVAYSVVVYLVLLFILWIFNIISVYSLGIINVTTEVVVSIISVYFILKKKILWQKNTTI